MWYGKKYIALKVSKISKQEHKQINKIKGEIMYIKQDVVCPKCGCVIDFDDFSECIEISSDPCSGVFVEHCEYNCPVCKNTFSANIEYEMKFKRVVQ
jgi:hypothetical protein